jgi:hypothetical protein
MAQTTLRWRLIPDHGMEHVVVTQSDGDIIAEGLVIGGAGASAFGVRYRCVLDADWAGWRSVHVTLVGGLTLALRHDGYGGWTDASGQSRPEFAGARDVFFGASAFSLCACVRRIAPKADGRAREGKAVFIAAPSLKASAIGFTLERTAPKAVALGFVDPPAAHAVELGADGYVETWPGLFERQALSVEREAERA